MSAKHRIVLCFLSVLLAYGGVAISGGWQPAAKLLHKWYAGVLAIFLFVFIITMFLTLRGRIVRSPWPILISAVLSYPAATFAYIVYFAVFEHQLFFNTLKHIEVTGLVLMLFLFGPTISFAWLFGAVAGLVFIILRRALQLQRKGAVCS